jgi:hypothetical protein
VQGVYNHRHSAFVVVREGRYLLCQAQEEGTRKEGRKRNGDSDGCSEVAQPQSHRIEVVAMGIVRSLNCRAIESK